MSANGKKISHQVKQATTGNPQLRAERELRRIAQSVLRIASLRGVRETEVHVDEVIDALTRFAAC